MRVASAVPHEAPLEQVTVKILIPVSLINTTSPLLNPAEVYLITPSPVGMPL